jgi:thiol-disulfide isomerase/thioredoxin
MTPKRKNDIRSTKALRTHPRPGGARSMALVTFLFVVGIAALNVFAADPQQLKPSSDSPKIAAATNSLPANPDAAWKEIETASRPPVPPAEWAGKAPTPEQREAFNKSLGEKSLSVASKAKEFYTRFPDHPKAGEAKRREDRFLQQAVSLGSAAVAEEATANLPEDKKLQQKINAVHQRSLAKRAEGSQAVVKELEGGIRELIKDYPDKPILWEQMLLVAQNKLTKEEKKRILVEIVDSKVADRDTIFRAKAAVKAVGALGQPLEIAFIAADGRKVDVQKMKGKVVLIDFWAAWCGPCIQSLPEVVKLYNKYHEDGFEIVGINMDKQQSQMESVVSRFKMPWPQYFDGKGWGNKFSLEYNVTAIPSVWLVDKKGILRTMEARQNLEEKIKELLEEKTEEKEK